MPNQKRKRECDVFKAFLVENADYAGSIELPCIKTSDCLPKKVIPFSKAMERRTTDFEQWVVGSCFMRMMCVLKNCGITRNSIFLN